MRKLQNGIFREIRGCAILKFNSGKAVLRRQGVALLQRQIDGRVFPHVAAGMRDEDLPFGAAQANDADIIGILSCAAGMEG